MNTSFLAVTFLIISNIFMTFAWYGHLQFQKWGILQKWGLTGIVLLSWFIALFEYAFQVPANRLGYLENGGSFSLFQLKTIQEVISLSVFLIINSLVFGERLQWNHLLAFLLIFLAVWVAFKKW